MDEDAYHAIIREALKRAWLKGRAQSDEFMSAETLQKEAEAVMDQLDALSVADFNTEVSGDAPPDTMQGHLRVIKKSGGDLTHLIGTMPTAGVIAAVESLALARERLSRDKGNSGEAGQ